MVIGFTMRSFKPPGHEGTFGLSGISVAERNVYTTKKIAE